MTMLRLFRPGPTQQKRFWLVERETGIPTRRVRLTKEERLYLFETGKLSSRGISGIASEVRPNAVEK